MRYSEKDFVEALSDNDADYDSDDDIVGEAVYDEEYLRKRKQRKNHSSSSEGDDEYQWDEDNVEEEEDEDDEDSLSISEDSDKPRKFKQLQGRTRRETKLRSVGNINPGLRRSKRATRNRINYRQLDMSDSEPESMKPEKSYASDNQSGPSENGDYMVEDEDSDDNEGEDQETKEDSEPPAFVPDEGAYVAEEGASAAEGEKEEQKQPPQKADSPNHEEVEGSRTRHFLDLNELAPTSGFDDGLNTIMKDEENDVQASPSS